MRIGEKKKLLSEALLSDSSLTKKSGDDAVSCYMLADLLVF